MAQPKLSSNRFSFKFNELKLARSCSSQLDPSFALKSLYCIELISDQETILKLSIFSNVPIDAVLF